MLRSVFTKTLYDFRRQAMGWAIGTGVLTTWLVSFYPIIRDSDEMADLFEQMPPQMMSAFGIDPDTILTGAGYLSGQLYSFMGPILMIAFAVSLGTAVTATEERNNTLDMLLAAPVSRIRVISLKLAASVLLASVVPVTMAVSLLVLNEPVGLRLSVVGIISMNVALLLLGLLFGAITAAAGSLTGKPGSARGIALTLAVLTWFASAFEPFFDWLAIPNQVSPFTWYVGQNLFLEPWSMGLIWIALTTMVIAGSSIWLFTRRDIATELAVLPDTAVTRRRSRTISPRRVTLLRSVAGKTMWDRRRTIFYWMGGIASLLLVTFAAWPALAANAVAMEAMVNALPTEMFAMFGMTNPESLSTPEGFISSRAYLNMGPLIMILFTVGGVSSLLSKEEQSGVLDMVASNPLPRRTVLLHKVGALTLQTALIALFLVIVAFAGNALWDTGLVPINMIGANVGLALLGLFFGGMALAVWSLTQSGGTAVAITSAFAVVTYFVNGLGSVVDSLAVVRPLSPFYWYIGDTPPLAKGIDPLYGLLALGAVIGTAIAVWRFDKRDLAV
ncbi:MAG: ABC transporter permease subunit [Actinomycetota bacterium]